MKQALKKLLNQTVHVAKVTSYDGPNEVLETPRAIQAYVEIVRDRVSAPGTLGTQGTELSASHLIVTEDEITLDDRVWLPGFDQTDESFSRQPDSVNAFHDPRTGAVSHYETRL